MVKEDKGQPVKKPVLKGITRNMRIAMNTIHQAVKMVQRTGVEVIVKEEETQDDVMITLRFPK